MESGKLSNVVDAQSSHLAIEKVKYLRTWNFTPKCPPSKSSNWGKDFENRLNTFGDIGFFWHSVQVESGKLSNVVDAQSSHLAFAKVKYLRTWNFPPKCPPPLKRSVLSQRFQKSVEYPWRYGIFPGTVYRLKVANFQILSIRKFSPCHCKSKIPAHLKLYTQMPSRKSFEMRQRFRKSFEYLGRYCIFLAQFTGWKWQTFKCCRCAMFSPCHCKSKTPAHLKFSTQMPTLKIFELRQRFRKSVEYLRRYRVFGGTVYRLKVENFQMLSMGKVFTLSLQK